jgi:transposase
MRPGRRSARTCRTERRVDDRTVISDILHVLKTGCRWRDVPAVYGPPTTISNSYNRWSRRRVLQRIFGKMAGRWPHSRRALHQQQPGQSASLGERLKKGEFEETIGGSRGGRTARFMLWPMIAADRSRQRTLFQLLARRAQTCSGGRRGGHSEAPIFQVPSLHISLCIPAV